MISITTKSPYAVRALVELYRHGEGPVPIAELARRGEIPSQFLEQLFATLRRAGVLRSPLGAGATGVFADAARAARAVLAESTVAEVAEAEIRAAGAPMYHI